MKRTSWVLTPLLAVCLLLGGCAGDGDWFIRYGSDDNFGRVTVKTLGNIGLGAFYLVGAVVALIVVLCDVHDAVHHDSAPCDTCHHNPCTCRH